MLDYCRTAVFVGVFFCCLTACQTRPKSGANNTHVKTDVSEKGQELRQNKFLPYLRTPSVIYFDPNSQLVDVSETLEILSYEGAVFGWTVPIHAGHPEFVATENILQICQDGRKTVLTNQKKIAAASLTVQMYREFDEEDCRGIYIYEIIFDKEPILNFKLSIM